jgi:hypothetical protein
MTNLKSEYKYCAFIDVLGYGSIVTTIDKSTEKKIEMLNSIFKNLQTTISTLLKLLKEKHDNKRELYVKSFSDSVFFQSDDSYTILFSLYNIFSTTFGYYTNFSYEEHCTVLLRAGVVKDWTLKIMDIGSLARNEIKKMPENEEFQNPIGLGVARAYFTSEKSGLSGMRVLISPEVLEGLNLIPFTEVSFECYFIEGENLLFSNKIPNDIQKVKIFFMPVRQNERGDIVNLYELCWPVYKYSWSENKTDIDVFVAELLKIEPEYKIENVRHLKRTAELLLKSFEIALAINPNAYTAKQIKYARENMKLIVEKK